FGAFLAGLIVGNSAQRQIVYQLAKPIESILMMIFFLSIGLLIDLPFLWDNIALVLVLWLFIAVFKTALNMGALHLLGERWQVAFLSSVILAQIGEFSFVLGAAAIDRQIIDTNIYRLIVAVTVLSLVTSPIYMLSARRIQRLAANRVVTLKDLLRLVYFHEWILTLRATARVVSATQKTADAARALAKRRSKPSAEDESAAAAAAGPTEPAPPDKQDAEKEEPAALASNPEDGAEKTAEQDPAEEEPAQADAGLRPGTTDGRTSRGGRRGRARPVGRTGRRRSDGH
ncbi:MAG: cation:proton antiporter, partial [Alphaproteobacteria bacterium]|nr:cation:proton antiporter [Alphaproteobacteria bacterium]